ncbi:hypothetical protein FQA39_LY10569 [Lamprigera yunnana]|nr:hypothetical protein FQA39_LY10569 [Lamprigera yunnana]
MDIFELNIKLICEKHFIPTDININNKRKLLNKNAVPVKYVEPIISVQGTIKTYGRKRKTHVKENTENSSEEDEETLAILVHSSEAGYFPWIREVVAQNYVCALHVSLSFYIAKPAVRSDAYTSVVDQARHILDSFEDITTFDDLISRQPAVDYSTTSYHSVVVDIQRFTTHALLQTFATKESSAYDGAKVKEEYYEEWKNLLSVHKSESREETGVNAEDLIFTKTLEFTNYRNLKCYIRYQQERLQYLDADDNFSASKMIAGIAGLNEEIFKKCTLKAYQENDLRENVYYGKVYGSEHVSGV